MDEEAALLLMRLEHFRAVSELFESTLDRTNLGFAEPGGTSVGFDEFLARAFEGIDRTFNVPNLFRRSLFVAAYALLEHHLVLFAEESRKKSGLSLSVTDIHGKGIDRSRVYLRKAVGISFPDESREWQEIKKFGTLRNLVVHRFGRVELPLRDHSFAAWVEKTPGIDIVPMLGAIWIDRGFVDYTLQTIQSFFEQLGYDFPALRRAE
jgi:hypothetical protein